MNQPSVEPPSAEAFEAPEPEAKLEVQDLQKPDIDEPCGGTVAGSEMAEVLRLARMFAGYPDEERVVHFRDLGTSEQQKIWILQQWLRGELEAYDPGSYQPILPPRGNRGLPVSWGYISSFILDLDPGFHVDEVIEPPNLDLYGVFQSQPNGLWSFELNSDDCPDLMKIVAGRPLLKTEWVRV